MAIWAGYSLGGTSLPEDELEPYIQQAMDQVSHLLLSLSNHLDILLPVPRLISSSVTQRKVLQVNSY